MNLYLATQRVYKLLFILDNYWTVNLQKQKKITISLQKRKRYFHEPL